MGYLYTFLKPHHKYLRPWTELHRRVKRFQQIFVIGGAINLLVLAPLSYCLNFGFPIGLGLFVWWGVLFVSGISCQFFACPRCGKIFSHSPYWGQSFLNENCLHCKLPRYAPCDPEEQNWEFESHRPPE